MTDTIPSLLFSIVSLTLAIALGTTLLVRATLRDRRRRRELEQLAAGRPWGAR